jgi:hypothetical protein
VSHDPHAGSVGPPIEVLTVLTYVVVAEPWRLTVRDDDRPSSGASMMPSSEP